MSEENEKSDKKKVKSLRAEWNKFQHTFIPPNAPANQRMTIQDAFWAGMITVYHKVLHELTELPDEEAEAELKKMGKEISEYADGAQERARLELQDIKEQLHGLQKGEDGD